MKKFKSEIILFAVIILVVLLGLFFGIKSKGTKEAIEIPYSESSSVNYKVYLNDKTYYNADYLEEGMQYITSIIKYVDLNYKYNASFKDVSEYNIKKTVTANIKITDVDRQDKVIYQKSETLKEDNTKSSDLTFDDHIQIDYKKYNNIVNEIKSKYAISANSTLTVSYNLIYSSIKDGITKTKTIDVVIPLSEKMINITKPADDSIESVYIGTTTDTFISFLFRILMFVMFAVALAILALICLRVYRKINGESKYDRFISKVLREYDSYITETKEDSMISNKPVIKVSSFKELLDVRNNQEKAIVYTKLDNNTSKFQIIDEQIYEYIVSRDEMDK